MSLSAEQIVQLTINIILQHEKTSESAVFNILKQKHMSESEANQAVTFVPVAFAHIWLKPTGIRIADTFILRFNDDVEKCYLLKDNLIYTSAQLC
jgi:hypothetical protein